MEKSTKSLIAEIFLGIFVHNGLCALAAAVWIPEKPVFIGLFLGMVSAALMLLHMAYCLERAIDTGDYSAASKKTAAGSVIRNFCYFVLLLVILWKFSEQVNVLAVVIGALGLKTGAYLQPAIHKLFQKK